MILCNFIGLHDTIQNGADVTKSHGTFDAKSKSKNQVS